MIIRRKHKNRFTVVPNSIFADNRLSIEAKGTLGYLLSRPPNWEVRHGQLQTTLRIGRRLLERIVQELMEAGYLQRDREQGRDELNRFTTYNYVVRDVPIDVRAASTPVAVAQLAQRRDPMHDSDNDNKEDRSKTDLNKTPSLGFPSAQLIEPYAALDQYTDFGKAALFNGMQPVWEGSKPYRAWVRFRGPDGIPIHDEATIDGVRRRVIWMPSLYPPRHELLRLSSWVRSHSWFCVSS
jgi:hypothetical protein